jgi:hypothetical protein
MCIDWSICICDFYDMVCVCSIFVQFVVFVFTGPYEPHDPGPRPMAGRAVGGLLPAKSNPQMPPKQNQEVQPNKSSRCSESCWLVGHAVNQSLTVNGPNKQNKQPRVKLHRAHLSLNISLKTNSAERIWVWTFSGRTWAHQHISVFFCCLGEYLVPIRVSPRSGELSGRFLVLSLSVHTRPPEGKLRGVHWFALDLHRFTWICIDWSLFM